MTIIFQLAILIFSVVIHEVSHGLAAQSLGDPTAKYAGRLTLNPLKHLDPVGSFFVPLITFVIPHLLGGSGFFLGWAKPVPYNPAYLKLANKDFGSLLVGIAGPVSNLLIAAVFGLFLRLQPFLPLFPDLAALTNIMSLIIFINIALAIFNLLPIPPLDGSKILFFFLPRQWAALRHTLEQFGFFFLLLLLFYAPALFGLLSALMGWLFRLFTGLPG